MKKASSNSSSNTWPAKQHFVEYVERFVNVSWEKKALVAIIKKHNKTTGRRQAAIIVDPNPNGTP